MAASLYLSIILSVSLSINLTQSIYLSTVSTSFNLFCFFLFIFLPKCDRVLQNSGNNATQPLNHLFWGQLRVTTFNHHLAIGSLHQAYANRPSPGMMCKCVCPAFRRRRRMLQHTKKNHTPSSFCLNNAKIQSFFPTNPYFLIHPDLFLSFFNHPVAAGAKEVLGIECTTSLEEALEEVIPWIKEQVTVGQSPKMSSQIDGNMGNHGISLL